MPPMLHFFRISALDFNIVVEHVDFDIHQLLDFLLRLQAFEVADHNVLVMYPGEPSSKPE
jgi:hypothetical protein